MKEALLLQRIKTKANAPDLFETNECLVWTGAFIPGGRILRKQWDRYEYVSVKPSSKIMHKGKMTSVPRALHTIMTSPTQPFRSFQTCQTHLCINPRHWVFQPIGEAPPEFTYNPEEWTREEARDFIDRYLATNDPNLIADIPQELLNELLPQAQSRE